MSEEKKVSLTLNVSMVESKMMRGVEAMRATFPQPMIPNPDYVEGGDLEKEIPQFTSEEWLSIQFRNWLFNLTKKYEERKARIELKRLADEEDVEDFVTVM